MTGAAARLRAETQAAHDRVDAAFGAHDLADRDDYAAFLGIQARALIGAERYLAAASPHLRWRERATLIADDLARLGAPPPAPLILDLPDRPGIADGVVYVLEGSRLGGGMLARQVPGDFPHRYLSAVHHPGEWRDLRTAIDRLGAADAAWLIEALTGARACFGLFERAIR